MNKSRKITGILLACCALLMVAIAGLGVTLAKYVKNVEPREDSASVAKFGVAMAWTDENAKLFNTEYAATTKDLEDFNKQEISLSVKSSGTGDVIAPGTSGSIVLSFANSTASEVAFNLKVNISQEYSANWKKSANGEVYHPIVFTVGSDATANGTPITDVTTNNPVALDLNFAAGTTLAGTMTISWSWPFSTEDNVNDAADTYMGTLAEAATYAITISATATQID